MGGIYFGIFTANEAGGIGAFGAFVLFIIKGKNLKNNFFSALSETAQTTAMVFIIVLGALIFGRFLAISNFTTELAAVVGGFQVSRYIVLAMILVMYLFLGCVMDSLAMILITLPIIYPLIVMMGFDSIWFGVIVILICEMGLITPPIGINVFVVKGVAPEVPLEVIFRGNIPFLIALIVCVIILIAFPQIALVLPNLMM
jgi:tripartite ATP-independent transporter DctM subunit